MMLWQTVFLLTAAVSLAERENSKPWTLPTSDDEKKHPVHICDPKSPTQRIPIPRRPDCSELHKDEQRVPPRPVVFTIMKPDIRLLEMNVFLCKKLEYKSICTENLFGAIYQTEKTYTALIDREECESLHRKHNSSGFEVNAIKILGERKRAECSWLTTKEVWSEETTLIRGRGIYDREHNAIRHGMASGSMCPADSGECKGVDYIIYWDHSSIPSRCAYLPYKDSIGTVSWEEDHTDFVLVSTSGGYMFTFSSYRPVRFDGCVFPPDSTLLSDEGIPIRFHHDPSITLMDLFRASKESWSILTSGNHRNSSHPGTNFGVSLDVPRINAGLKILTDTSVVVLKSVERKICKINELEWETAWGMRETSPQSAIRIFTRDSNVVGFFEGPFIYYIHCEATVKWALEVGGQCGGLWKLRSHKGMCLENARGIVIKCPESCSSLRQGSFIVGVNRTHSVDMNQSPVTPFPHLAFYSPSNVRVPSIRIEGTPFISVYDLAVGGGILSVIESVASRLEHVERGLYGFPNISSDGESMMGSPSFYAGLGFAAGKVTSWGSSFWVLCVGSVMIVWTLLVCCLIRAIIVKLWTKKARKPSPTVLPEELPLRSLNF